MVVMTKTAQHLMWDKEFIEKRIKDQNRYINRLKKKHLGGFRFNHKDKVVPFLTDRGQVLYVSAEAVRVRLVRVLENINKLK
jgi:hypothetical protein